MRTQRGRPEAPALGAVAGGHRGDLLARRVVRQRTGRPHELPSEVTDALWEAVARGLVASDGFAAVRALGEGRSQSRHTRGGPSRLRRGGHTHDRAAGRWSLFVPVPHSGVR
ncbi:MAG: hypothetical protein R2716_08725 [Microthrixaceae bacterium]